MKVAIVTGASQGIGAGIAGALVSAGYAVVGTSRSIQPSREQHFLTIPGDIAEPETAQRVVEQALDRFGRIDTLVNNAGIFIGKPFTDYTRADYDLMTAVNLAGFFHVTQRAITQMVTQDGGHVVNVTTSLVDHARTASASALASLTKGGLNAVTRSLATEYAVRHRRDSPNRWRTGRRPLTLGTPGVLPALPLHQSMAALTLRRYPSEANRARYGQGRHLAESAASRVRLSSMRASPRRMGRYCADTASGAQTGPEPITDDNQSVLAGTQESAANQLC